MEVDGSVAPHFASDQRESDNYVFWATHRPALGSLER